MTREEHLRAIYIVSSVKRGKRDGLLMLCGGPDCGGAEVFAAGRKAADVVAAAERHIEETKEEEGPVPDWRGAWEDLDATLSPSATNGLAAAYGLSDDPEADLLDVIAERHHLPTGDPA